jgi:NDP-sugar pyrophosphorylase family protein
LNFIILAGGYGERLKPLTNYVPKPLLPYNGVPVLRWILDGIELYCEDARVFVSTMYMHDEISKYVSENCPNVSTIERNGESKGDGVLEISSSYLRFDTESVIVINGDTYIDVDFNKLMEYHKNKDALCTMVCSDNNETFCDNWLFEAKKNVGIVGHSIVRCNNFSKNLSVDVIPKCVCDAGVYVFSKELLQECWNNYNYDLDLLINPAISTGKCYGFVSSEPFMDIGLFTVSKLYAIIGG